jgi:hypothetical protein
MSPMFILLLGSLLHLDVAWRFGDIFCLHIQVWNQYDGWVLLLVRSPPCGRVGVDAQFGSTRAMDKKILQKNQPLLGLKRVRQKLSDILILRGLGTSPQAQIICWIKTYIYNNQSTLLRHVEDGEILNLRNVENTAHIHIVQIPYSPFAEIRQLT